MLQNELSFVDTSGVRTTGDLMTKINEAPEGLLCLIDGRYAEVKNTGELVQRMGNADVLHAGLSFHSGKPLTNLQLCTFNWNFLNPPPSVEAVSWKPSLDFAVVEKSTVAEFDGLDTSFESPEIALIEFTYRVMISGGVTVHEPEFARVKETPARHYNLKDESVFILKHFNSNSFRFYQFSMLLLAARWVKAPTKVSLFKPRETHALRLLKRDRERTFNSYTALIPTINRYDYIEKSIRSLLRLSFPPAEIIVVDQSPKPEKEVYRSFEEQGVLRVLYLPKPGQSTARNSGLKIASHPWVLLFEDDAEAWPEMVNEHISLLKNSCADISTGIVVSPGQDESAIPAESKRYRLTDILTTGNAFLSLDTAWAAGGFDPAFDHGPGADDDFGKRLYLAGKKIVYNFKSIETHYKAPKGGMREHGAWWRNKSTFWGPFPPATQLYLIVKYYQPRFRFFLIASLVLKARKRYSAAGYTALLLLLPVKLFRSYRAVARLRRASMANT